MPSPLNALALAATSTRLSPFDLALVAVYLVAITLFGLRFREKKSASPTGKSLRSYFLANNTIPWWAISLSIVSAETSTLTIVSVPGVAYAGNFGFLQLVIGYMVGRIVVAILFLPRYFAGNMLTAYQLIDQRFGSVLHKVTAGLFLLTRAAAEGVRVFAVSIVVGIAIGTKDVLSIAIISALTLLYTFEGGMTAVIWTDVVQMFIYIGGTLVAILTLGSHVQGGWTAIHHVASAAGKFHMLNFAFNLTNAYTFWAGVLGGTFLTMASHGTDQLMVQRMLAARNLRESRLALLSSGAVIFLQFALFLLIGAGLYVFYGQHPGAVFKTNDHIFPTFIVREMPIGVAGLLVAAILAAAMSNLSAALNSLSSTTVVDFYMRLRPAADDRERGIIAKSSTVLWALVLFAIAVYSVQVGGKGHVVEIGLSIASVAYGCLLGVFLLGTLTRYANQLGTSIGMVCGFALNIWLWQGAFPVHLGSITVPKIAFPWYTLIGAGVTFAIGSLASFIFRKQTNFGKPSRRTRTATASVLLLLLFFLSFPQVVAQTPGVPFLKVAAKHHHHKPQSAPPVPNLPGFDEVSALIDQAIDEHKLPGAVVVVGHSGQVVFHHAYGNRKVAGEPGLDGKPDAAEPMTEATLFDMASLTKDLATATAIMQLYEQGKLQFDDPIAKYFPEFAAPTGISTTASTATPTDAAKGQRPDSYQPGATPQVPAPTDTPRAESPTHTADPQRARVTLRMLLTHFSGETEDVSLKDPWGLAAPDRAEGLHRALTSPLKSAPGVSFRYSDINFILLGALIEKLSGQREDDYVREHIYKPLGMTDTRYLPLDQACGSFRALGAAVVWQPNFTNGKNTDNTMWTRVEDYSCPPPKWMPLGLLARIAPTAHDNEGNAQTNSDFDHLLRGTVHDPTTRRMGGVAGHAGLFSTAHDVALFAQALLDRLAGRPSAFPLKQSTLILMTTPEQPGHTTGQLTEANAANSAAIAAGTKPAAPLLAPAYPALPHHDLRGYGWDIDTAFSKPRGAMFPIGSFGHTGFTGTSLWMDPGSDTYIVLLANAIHPRGNVPISNLRGAVSTATARALGLYPALDIELSSRPERSAVERPTVVPEPRTSPETLTGIDALEASHFSQLVPLAAHHNDHLNLGLLTNPAGIDRNRRRTIDILAVDLPKYIPAAKLVTLFSPEHGIFATHDTTNIGDETDPATGLHVTGLYGAKDAQRRPSHDQLKDLDAVVIDLQDAGVRFWTYESVLGYFLEAAATEERTYNHRLDIVVLDRPPLNGGAWLEGPVSDPGVESYTDFMPLPVRHGMTYGELARYFNQYKLGADNKPLDAPLTIIRVQHWIRDQFFDATGLPWVNPSPNMRNVNAAILYPGIALLESSNISVGRGTDSPLEVFGAGVPPASPQKPGGAWFNATTVAAALNARHIPGVRFTPTTIPVVEDSNKYPGHGQTIEVVRIAITDRVALDSPEMGIEIAAALHRLYPTHFQLEKTMRIIGNQATLEALTRGDDPRAIAATWQPALD
ncbi:MAG: sodium/solute symporter, partial [Acidobacteriaceae bacterium]